MEVVGASAVGSDLRFLFTSSKVDAETQEKFISNEVTSVKQFAALVETVTELRDLLKKDFGMDADTLGTKVRISNVVVAWKAAVGRIAKQIELEGVAETLGEPKKIAEVDNQAMRAAFENKWGEIEDVEVPAKTYLEKRLDQIEKNSLVAETLSEVLNEDEDEGNAMQTVLDPKGNFMAVRAGNRVPLPLNTEQLRQRISIMGNSWIFAGFQQTTKRYLQDVTPKLWDKYIKYLLGEHVLGLTTSGPMSSRAHDPQWEQVLHYEFAMRRHALKLVMRGKAETLGIAILEAMKDTVVKERNFTTPLSNPPAKRRPEYVPPPPVRDHEADGEPAWKKTRRGSGRDRGNKGKGDKGDRGKGKGTRKGSAATTVPGCESTTPDGKNICYSFNNAKEKCIRKDCRYAHVCGRCFKVNRPMYACDHK